ncbi:MAG: signal peptidase II [Bacilli bacterium]|nr:signal peptidase II [Bacilli bacterium]
MDKVKKYASWFFHSFIWLGLLLLIIDIVTKNVVVANRDYIRSLPNSRIELIPGFLGITYVINNNAAFGLGTTSDLWNRILYIIIATIAIAVLIFVYVKYFKRLGKMYKACIMLMTVGALGNLIDRVFFTAEYLGLAAGSQPGVVDWIDFHGIWSYVFNIADSAIVIGTIMLIVWLIVEEVRDSKKRNSQVHLKKEDIEAKKEEQVQPEEEAPVENKEAHQEAEKPLDKEENPAK